LLADKILTLRQHLTNYNNLKKQITQLEKETDVKLKDTHQALNYLLQKDKTQIEQENRGELALKQNVNEINQKNKV